MRLRYDIAFRAALARGSSGLVQIGAVSLARSTAPAWSPAAHRSRIACSKIASGVGFPGCLHVTEKKKSGAATVAHTPRSSRVLDDFLGMGECRSSINPSSCLSGQTWGGHAFSGIIARMMDQTLPMQALVRAAHLGSARGSRRLLIDSALLLGNIRRMRDRWLGGPPNDTDLLERLGRLALGLWPG